MTKRFERIDTQKDMVIQEHCGCRIIFLGSCHLHTSRMECCSVHDRSEDFEFRDRFSARAREERDSRLLNQPPECFSMIS